MIDKRLEKIVSANAEQERKEGRKWQKMTATMGERSFEFEGYWDFMKKFPLFFQDNYSETGFNGGRFPSFTLTCKASVKERVLQEKETESLVLTLAAFGSIWPVNYTKDFIEGKTVVLPVELQVISN